MIARGTILLGVETMLRKKLEAVPLLGIVSVHVRHV